MANYNFVVNSTYNPFTFDELIKPYQLYGTAFNTQEERYNQLAEDSAKWGDQLKPDSEAYRMWNEFQTGISDAANQLMTNGLTPATRGVMSKVRQSYGKNIKSIEAADAEYKKALALRDQIRGNDPSARYKKEISLDDYLHGKKGSTEYLSGKNLRAETADMAEKLGTAIFSNPSFDKAMGNYYYQIGLQKGAPAEMLQFIQDGNLERIPHGENASAEDNALYRNMKSFADLYNTQISRTNGYSEIDANDLKNEIFQGMYSGLAKPAYDYQRDLGVMTASEAAADKRQRETTAEGIREFNIGLKGKGYDKDGNIDPNSPVWIMAGYNTKGNADPTKWEIIGKPGTNKSGSGSGSGGGSSTEHSGRIKKAMRVVTSNSDSDTRAENTPGYSWELTDDDIDKARGTVMEYGALTPNQKERIKAIIGNDDPEGYVYRQFKEDATGLGSGDNWYLDVIPKNNVVNSVDDVNYQAH